MIGATQAPSGQDAHALPSVVGEFRFDMAWRAGQAVRSVVDDDMHLEFVDGGQHGEPSVPGVIRLSNAGKFKTARYGESTGPLPVPATVTRGADRSKLRPRS